MYYLDDISFETERYGAEGNDGTGDLNPQSCSHTIAGCFVFSHGFQDFAQVVPVHQSNVNSISPSIIFFTIILIVTSVKNQLIDTLATNISNYYTTNHSLLWISLKILLVSIIYNDFTKNHSL